MISDILEKVLSKAVTQLQSYQTLYSADWNSDVWRKFEERIGSVYLSYLRSLLRDPHIPYSADVLPYTVQLTGAPPFGEGVTLGAINQRGLFRQNGRATLLEPCGQFLPRTSEPSRHEALHQVYMHLVRKAESINQLFLGTTDLRSLAVLFGGTGRPRIKLSDDRLHGIVHVPDALANLLASQSLRDHWNLNYARSRGWLWAAEG